MAATNKGIVYHRPRPVNATRREAIQAYYASTSFMDAQAGVVLDAQRYDMESDPGEISNLAQDFASFSVVYSGRHKSHRCPGLDQRGQLVAGRKTG